MVTIETEKPEDWQEFTVEDALTQEVDLKELLVRASESLLYRDLWKTTDFDPEKFLEISDLNKIPFLTRERLFETTRSKANDTAIAPIGHWFLGHNNDEVHEWYPYSNEDFLGIAPALSRLSDTTGLHEGEVVLVVVDTPPHISSFIPYLWSYAKESKKCGLEFINGSLEWYDSLVMSWITFVQKRPPTAILASKKNAAALAEKLDSMDTSVKDVLPELRVGIFFGEGTKNQLKSYADAEIFEVYSPVEHMAFWSECKSHNGIHAWQDTAIIEVLPDDEKEAQLICNTKEGTKGELIITNFNNALPLVRYRTGKRIRVEDTGKCSCGAEHPRITFFQ
jgi:phenylacetate-coenzyme A ligase PaaK-like adenylate-forming protein